MSRKPDQWWDDPSWNPIVGCSKISPGCLNCWAERQAKRWGQEWGKVILHPERLTQPLHWRKPRTVAVCLMGDLFHEDVPNWFLAHIFAGMLQAHRHTYVVLTKRPERMRRWIAAALKPCPPHIWLGVSAENQERADERIPILRRIPAAVHWLSLEPLLGPIVPDLTDIEWVVVGAETGPGKRPMDLQWARQIRDQCTAAGVPFWFKRDGEGSHELDERTWEEKP